MGIGPRVIFRSRSLPNDEPSLVQVVLSLSRGGLEVLAVDLAAGLKERGFRPVLVALDEGGPLEQRLTESGIEYAVLGGRRFKDARFHLSFARLLRQLRARVVHTHTFAPLAHSLPAMSLARVKRVVHTEHSFEYIEHRRHHQLTLRALSKRTDAFTLVGQRMHRFYADTVGVAPSKLRVIVNGIDVAPRAPERERAEIRKELGLPIDKVLIGTAARVTPVKNLQLLVRAAARCIPDVPIHLVVLGDGEDRRALEQLASDLRIANSVSFLGWRTDVRRVIDALDVYAVTSLTEGLPLAMLEGMAAELPIVSTPVGDVPLLVRDGETGFIIAQQDEGALADRLRQLALDPALRARLGQAARDVVSKTYDRTTMIGRYVDAYGF